MPVVLEIADARGGAADGAWIVDFTNPVGIVTRALLDDGHQAVGLCNVAINFQRDSARLLGVEPERVQRRPGRAQPPELGAAPVARRGGRAAQPARRAGRVLAERLGFPVRLLEELGAVPSYYLRYFYAHDAVLAEQLVDGAVPRAQAVAEIERELLGLYRDPALAEKPALLEQRGGAYYSEAATGLVASLASGDGAVHVADVRNATRFRVSPPTTWSRCPATWTARAFGHWLNSRSHPSCSGSSSTSPHTSGSRWRPRSTRDRPSPAGPCLRTAVGQIEQADELRRAAARRRGRDEPRSSWPSTAGTPRPDLALVDAEGGVPPRARGASSPYHLGVDGSLDVLAGCWPRPARR